LLRELNDIDVIDAFEVKVKKKKKNLKERPGRGDNTGIKKFPSAFDPAIRYYHGLGRDLWYTVEIDD
jgi:hypothetical protein